MSFVFPPSLLTFILASHIKSLKEGRKYLPWKLCFWVPILYNFLPVCKLRILGYEIFNKHNFDVFPPKDLYFTKRNFYNCAPPPPFCLMGTLGKCWFWDSATYFQQITVLKPMKSDSSKHYSVISEYKWFIFLFSFGVQGERTHWDVWSATTYKQMISKRSGAFHVLQSQVGVLNCQA